MYKEIQRVSGTHISGTAGVNLVCGVISRGFMHDSRSNFTDLLSCLPEKLLVLSF